MPYGKLILIPTPLSESGVLEPVAFAILNEASTSFVESSVFVIEDLKPGRKRWLEFGLPRHIVDHFFLYNEHNALESSKLLLDEIKIGKTVYLMSDGGLPAFYDPGIELVRLCHQHKIKVTSTPFFNSVVLALALSGFNHRKFWFEGFLPLDQVDRKSVIKKLLISKETSILMDTPYRLKRVLEEISEVASQSGFKKKLFLALDLGKSNEELILGTSSEMLEVIKDFKREFVLLFSE